MTATAGQWYQALFDELNSLRKAGSVAKLVFERRNFRSDDGVRVVRGVRQLRHGHAEQQVEARWLEMDGEVVDAAKDGQASARARLGTHRGNTRRGVARTGSRAMDAVTISEGERQELLGPSWQGDHERDGIDVPRSHAICPDVRLQYRACWRHSRLKHMGLLSPRDDPQ